MAVIFPGNLHLRYPKLNFIHFQVSLYLLLLVAPATSLNFSFPSFNYSVLNDIIKPGEDAQLDDSTIQLTRDVLESGSDNSTGRVYYNAPVQLWDKETRILTNFTTYFSFTIRDPSIGTGKCGVDFYGHYVRGDGIAFFLAPYGFKIPDYLPGHGLGIFNDNISVINNPNIVAVEFDTYKNYFDPDSHHIGIDVNSVISVENISCNGRFWDWMINTSSTWEASVRYDSSSLNLSVVLTCANKSLSYCDYCSLDYLIDLREYLTEQVTVGFSASTGMCFELNELNSWNFTSSLEIEDDNYGPMAAPPTSIPTSNPTSSPTTMPIVLPTNNNGNNWMVVGLVVGAAAIMITTFLVGLFLFFRQRRKNKKNHADDDVVLDVPIGPKEFLYAELAGATSNFDEKQKLGEGGFGGVYRGFLNDPKMDVAVKRISKGSKQGTKEYASEVKVISRLRHRNLVQLVGWCHQRKELLLVYEFMPNGSLDFHLFRNRGSLTWQLRYRIALELASALQYLHEGWEKCILHRDIKSSNIILDSNFHAKLGDFGLARLVEHENGSQKTNIVAASTIRWPMEYGKVSKTTNVVGTMGYMAPEYVNTGKASKETDVYSFGIVLLEIACGRKPVQIMADPSEVNLVEWVWKLYGRQKHLEAADPSQSAMDSEKKLIECMIIVGLWCAQEDYNLRPSIVQAINVLKFDAPLPFLPYNIHVAPSSDISTFSITSSYEHSSKSCPTDSIKLNISSTASSSSAASFL